VSAAVTRYLAEAPATLSAEFRSASTNALVDPTGGATVEVRRADGTALVPAGTAATKASAGVYTYTLTAAQTTLLDNLTVRWTATFGGQPQTLIQRAEIVGGYFFSTTELRQLAPLNDTVAYTADMLGAARTAAESLIEEEIGLAFVPRYFYGRVRTLQRPPREPLRAWRSITDVAGGAWPASSLTLMGATAGAWPRRRGLWTVGVEYGMDACPPDVADAARLLAREGLARTYAASSSGLDARATSVTYADAGLTYGLVTSGVRGAATDVAEVNAAIARWQGIAVA